jgi:hypothetical protein
MIRLVVNEHNIDLPSSLKIQIKRQNPAYLGQDAGVIKGSFSYPFSLPLTPANRVALNYPDRIDSAEVPAQELPASLYVGPDLLMKGSLTVAKPTRDTVKVYLISNPLKDLTKVKMNEADQGSVSAADEAALALLMKDTTTNPFGYDAIFAPVYNIALRDDLDKVPAEAHFHNAWNFDDQVFTVGNHVTPLPRVAPILKRAIESAGYTFDDGLHVTDEMRRQVLVNNRSLRYDNQLSTRMPLNLCLPNITVAEFLKSLCRTYCLATFSSLTGDHIDLVPLRSLVRAAPRKDWTAYAAHEYARDPDASAVSLYTWGDSANAQTYFFAEWANDFNDPDYARRDFLDDDTDEEVPVHRNQIAYYYSRAAVSIRKKIKGLLGFVFLNSFGYVDNNRSGDTVTPTVPPAQTNYLHFFPSSNDKTVMATMAATPVGIETAAIVVPELFGEITSESGDVVASLSFYRGMQFSRSGQLYPMLSHFPYTTNQVYIDGEITSLSWLGPNGLYEQWWKEWDGMLRESAGVERTFALPLVELLAINFKDKVRVENRNYFVRSIEFSVGVDGVSPAKCELVSVS